MTKIKEQSIVCQICKKQMKLSLAIPGEMVKESIADVIRKSHPDWTPSEFICLHDLNNYRAEYIRQCLEEEKGELSALDAEVIQSIKDQELLSKNINAEYESQLSFGNRVADNVAAFGGSWKFIILFFIILVIWIAGNSMLLFGQPFDPYPYILMNLILSCLAAIQAPIIMMSQNRQEAKDRLRSEHDYRVNLKAELEIRHLNAKMDQLLNHQWHRLMEIQEIQTELMEELAANKRMRQ
jgi:uncharacterized membrane protein